MVYWIHPSQGCEALPDTARYGTFEVNIYSLSMLLQQHHDQEHSTVWINSAVLAIKYQ